MGSLEVSGGGSVVLQLLLVVVSGLQGVSSGFGIVEFFEDKVSSGVHLVQPPCTSMASQSRFSGTVQLDFKYHSPRMETPEPL